MKASNGSVTSNLGWEGTEIRESFSDLSCQYVYVCLSMCKKDKKSSTANPSSFFPFKITISFLILKVWSDYIFKVNNYLLGTHYVRHDDIA